MEFLSEGLAVAENVYILDEHLISKIQSNPGWKDRESEQTKSQVIQLNPQVAEIAELVDSITMHLNTYGERYPTLTLNEIGPIRAVRYSEGGFFVPHADVNSIVSVVLFLNDDYEGGVLNFNLHNVRIEPKASKLVIFPANYTFVHEQEKVTKGYKYLITMNFS